MELFAAQISRVFNQTQSILFATMDQRKYRNKLMKFFNGFMYLTIMHVRCIIIANVKITYYDVEHCCQSTDYSAGPMYNCISIFL